MITTNTPKYIGMRRFNPEEREDRAEGAWDIPNGFAFDILRAL